MITLTINEEEKKENEKKKNLFLLLKNEQVNEEAMFAMF